MGYLKVIQSNTTWVCPKTATYKIICVASGTPNAISMVNNPTSFGTYCTAYGFWNSSHSSGYSLQSYAEFTNTNYSSGIGYGAAGESLNLGGVGRLNVSIADIKKDTSVACTIGEPLTSGNTSSNSGVIVVQEIGEIPEESIIDDDNNKNEFTINLYRYGDLYKAIKVKEGSSIVLPTLPLYSNDELTGDIAHVGYAITYNGGKVYNVNQSIYPLYNMDLYAGYSYKYASYYEVGTSRGIVRATAEYSGYCDLYVKTGVNDHAPSGNFTFSINGNTVVAGKYNVNKGDIITANAENVVGNIGAYIKYPYIASNNWRLRK